MLVWISSDYVTMTDPLTCLALAIYFEARSESLAGQYLVVNTIMNRVESVRYPSTICGVVAQKHQFSFYWDGIPERMSNKLAADRSLRVATNAVAVDMSYYDGCHYHGDWIAKPHWAYSYKEVLREGKHIFYEGGC